MMVTKLLFLVTSLFYAAGSWLPDFTQAVNCISNPSTCFKTVTTTLEEASSGQFAAAMECAGDLASATVATAYDVVTSDRVKNTLESVGNFTSAGVSGAYDLSDRLKNTLESVGNFTSAGMSSAYGLVTSDRVKHTLESVSNLTSAGVSNAYGLVANEQALQAIQLFASFSVSQASSVLNSLASSCAMSAYDIATSQVMMKIYEFLKQLIPSDMLFDFLKSLVRLIVDWWPISLEYLITSLNVYSEVTNELYNSFLKSDFFKAISSWILQISSSLDECVPRAALMIACTSLQLYIEDMKLLLVLGILTFNWERLPMWSNLLDFTCGNLLSDPMLDCHIKELLRILNNLNLKKVYSDAYRSLTNALLNRARDTYGDVLTNKLRIFFNFFI